MTELSEIDLALKALRVYADQKSDLPPDELETLRNAAAALERRGWQFVGRGVEDPQEATMLLDEIKSVFGPLSRGGRRKRGRQAGSISGYTLAKDDLVLADIAAGATRAFAIRKHYPHGFEGHRKRIRKRIKALKEYQQRPE